MAVNPDRRIEMEIMRRLDAHEEKLYFKDQEFARAYLEDNPKENCRGCDYRGTEDCVFISRGDCKYIGLIIKREYDEEGELLNHVVIQTNTIESKTIWTRIFEGGAIRDPDAMGVKKIE